jgi:6-phosphogluconolactonase
LTSHLPSGHVSVLPIEADGSVGEPSDVKMAQPGAHQVVMDESGQHILVPCRDSDVVAQFLFDPASGQLSANEPPFVQVPAGSGARHIALDPSERHAYLVGEFTGALLTYDYAAATGTLASPSTSSTVPPGFSEKRAAHIMVHPSGRFMYSTNRDHASLVHYSLDQTTGRPTVVEHYTADGQLDAPRNFDIDPTGRVLVLANWGNNTVMSFTIDQSSGALTKVTGPLDVPYVPLCARIMLP